MLAVALGAILLAAAVVTMFRPDTPTEPPGSTDPADSTLPVDSSGNPAESSVDDPLEAGAR